MQAALHHVEDRAHLTVRGYASDVRIFERWCTDAGRNALPCTPDTVCLYVLWLLNKQTRKVTTAARHVSAIVDWHRRSGVEPPTTADAWKAISSTRKKRDERSVGKAAMTPEILRRASKACDSGTLLGLRDRAMLVIGFACALRRSEIAGLQLADVSFQAKGCAVMLRRSKTDQQGEGRYIGAWHGKRALTDPVQTLTEWIAARGSWRGPLFCRIQNKDTLVKRSITGEYVNDVVKRVLKTAGIDAEPYGAHSLRIGAVTAAAEIGGTDTELMGLSGHRSTAVMRGYVRPGRVFSGRNPLAGVL